MTRETLKWNKENKVSSYLSRLLCLSYQSYQSNLRGNARIE